MKKTAIQVENLSKKYVLDRTKSKGYSTFREDLMNLTKAPWRKKSSSYKEDLWALKDLNFTISAGERIGIIGKNGAGKSTLLKILSRITEPTKGIIRINGRMASLLEVGTGFHPELTGRENIYLNGSILGMKKSEITRRFDEIVDFAQVEKFLDTPVKRYSSGMYVRLAFSVAAHIDPEILVVDEVLSVGDIEFQKKCLGKLDDIATKDGRTVLFVSHNLGAVEKLCNRSLLISQGTLKFDGPTIDTLREYYKQTSLSSSSTLLMEQNPKNLIGITDVSIADSNQNAIYDLINGYDYTFKLKYKALSSFTNVRVILKIVDLSSRIYLCLSNYWKGNHFNVQEGDGNFIFNINRLPIPEGDYIAVIEIKADGLHIPDVELFKFSVILTHFFSEPKRSIQNHGVLVDHSVQHESSMPFVTRV